MSLLFLELGLARSLLIPWPSFIARGRPVFSVTSEAAASLSFQGALSRSAKADPSQGNDRFQALIDSSAPADTGNDRPNATAQPQSASHRRADDAPATADTKRSRNAAPADQAAGNNSDDRDA